MIRLEINASPQEIDDLIALLNGDSKFENIRQQIIDFKNLNEHVQTDEIPKEGDDEYIERSE